jgi:hypothetical protein
VSGQRLARIARLQAILTQRIAFAAQHGLQRIASQVVVIVESFVAQDQAVNALADQLLHAVLNITRVAVVHEPVGHLPQQTTVALPVAQQDATPIAGEVTASKIDLYFSRP